MEGCWYYMGDYLQRFGEITEEHIADDRILCPCKRKTSITIRAVDGKAVISSSQTSIMQQLLINNRNFEPDEQGILVYNDRIYGEKIVEVRGILSKDSIRISKQSE